MPSLQYWFNAGALVLFVSSAINVAMGLIGIKHMVSRQTIFILMALSCLVTLGGWWKEATQGEQSAKQEAERVELDNNLKSIAQFNPTIDALRRTEGALQGYEKADAIRRRILNQYDVLLSGIVTLETVSGKTSTADRQASAEHIIGELKAAISGNVQLYETKIGDVLIIQTGPNTFRVTFIIPTRVVPTTITFYDLPNGVKENVIEKSNVGFTVVFTPITTPIEKFPRFIASAEI